MNVPITMENKRVSDKYHRTDVKLPIKLYDKISEIAVQSFDAKIHHISKKPEITPTLLYLLELGIKSFASGNELSKKINTDNNTDAIPITDNEIRELIENALLPVRSRLEELSIIETKMNELTAIYKLINTDNNTDNKTDTDTDTIPLSKCDNLPLNEDSPHNVPDTENKAVKGENIEKKSLYDRAREYIAKMNEGDQLESLKAFEGKISASSGYFSKGKAKALIDKYFSKNASPRYSFTRNSTQIKLN